MVAVTLVAGIAVFSYVNDQAAVSENQLGVAFAGNVNYLDERFVVAQFSFNAYPTSNSLTIYFYNSGGVTDNFVQIDLYNSTTGTSKTDAALNILYTPSSVTNLFNSKCSVTTNLQNYESPALGTGASSFSVKSGTVSSITLTLPSCYVSPSGHAGTFNQGSTYSVRVLGQYGNTVTYYQTM
jgi:hypothetical protein